MSCCFTICFCTSVCCFWKFSCCCRNCCCYCCTAVPRIFVNSVNCSIFSIKRICKTKSTQTVDQQLNSFGQKDVVLLFLSMWSGESQKITYLFFLNATVGLKYFKSFLYFRVSWNLFFQLVHLIRWQKNYTLFIQSYRLDGSSFYESFVAKSGIDLGVSSFSIPLSPNLEYIWL